MHNYIFHAVRFIVTYLGMILSLNSQKNQTASISILSFASKYSVIRSWSLKAQQERESVIVSGSLEWLADRYEWSLPLNAASRLYQQRNRSLQRCSPSHRNLFNGSWGSPGGDRGGGIEPEPSSPPERRRWFGPLVSLGKAFVISVLVIDF